MSDAYVVTEDIVIPAGTVLKPAPTKTERCVPYFETVLGVGPNNTATFTLSEEALTAMGSIVPLQSPDLLAGKE